MDMWSVACTIYELYTGRILFPGNSNNQVGFLISSATSENLHKLIPLFTDAETFYGCERKVFQQADTKRSF
jgi:serine/threonine protein kinase